mgnify:CR=1 FL=1
MHDGKAFAAFLFDMDGTILTSIAVAERIWSDWARRHGIDPVSFLPTIHGVRGVETIARLNLPGIDPALEAERIRAEHAQAEAKSLQTEAKTLGAKLDAQLAESKKLSGEIQRTAAKAAQVTDSIRVEEKGSQIEDLPRPLPAVGKAAEEALVRNGYRVRVTVKTDQKAVFVTERKISTPTSVETAGSRNQYIVSLQALPSNVTRLSVKAEFERVAQGGRVLAVDAEEIAEIERRLIAEIGKAVASPSKL